MPLSTAVVTEIALRRKPMIKREIKFRVSPTGFIYKKVITVTNTVLRDTIKCFVYFHENECSNADEDIIGNTLSCWINW